MLRTMQHPAARNIQQSRKEIASWTKTWRGRAFIYQYTEKRLVESYLGRLHLPNPEDNALRPVIVQLFQTL